MRIQPVAFGHKVLDLGEANAPGPAQLVGHYAPPKLATTSRPSRRAARRHRVRSAMSVSESRVAAASTDQNSGVTSAMCMFFAAKIAGGGTTFPSEGLGRQETPGRRPRDLRQVQGTKTKRRGRWMVELPPPDIGGMCKLVSFVVLVSSSLQGSRTRAAYVDAAGPGGHGAPLAEQGKWANSRPGRMGVLLLARAESIAAASRGAEVVR